MNWLDRVIPLPKEIEITDTRMVKAGQVYVDVSGGDEVRSDPAVRTATELLQKLAVGSLDSKFLIRLVLLRDITPSDLVSRLHAVPNSEQAYAIYPTADSNDVYLTAMTPTGLLSAARTFMQLVNLKQTLAAEDEILLPIPRILDWPDIGERGQWGGNSGSDLKWTSQWKLNHLEAHVEVKLNADGYPEAHINPGLLDEARSLGVNLVPYIAHLESISESIGGLPEAAKSTPDPSKPLRSDYCPGICASSPASVELIASWLESVLSAVDVTDVCVWLSEESSPCFCKDCVGREQFEMETKLICGAFDTIKHKHPRLKLRLLLSQGSYPHNERVLAAKPDDVGATFYDGGRTYDSSRRPMIYPLLEDYSRAGGWLGCYPQITHSWRTIFPWTAPQFLQYRAHEFVDKKLNSITGYAVISNRQHEFNVAALAEYSWNSQGRTPEEFSRAYATVMGYDDPQAFARWAVLAGDAGWFLAESNLFLRLIYDPSLGLRGEVEFDHRFEMAQITQPGKLEDAILAARDALSHAQNLGLPNAIRESECCLAGLTAFGLIRTAQELLNVPILTEAQRTELSGILDELDRVALAVAGNQLAWAKYIEEKAKSNTLFSRVYDTGLVLFKTCDALRSVAEEFEIKDPLPQARMRQIGSWSGPEFDADPKPILEWGITELVDLDGGYYSLGLDYVDSAYHTDMLSIETVDESGNVLSRAENIPSGVSIWEKWKEYPIIVPQHDGKLTLRVQICGLPADAPADRRTCAATLGIRRLASGTELI